MSKRINMLNTWLTSQLGIQPQQIIAITNDASFRRYFRIMVNDTSYIAMDAPPEKENCEPYIDVAKRLRASGLNAPEIIASDLNQGFLLLTDFGQQLYLPALTESQADELYGDAIAAIVTMQTRTSSQGLPRYDHRLLHQEMSLFTDWLLDRHLHYSLSPSELTNIHACFELLSTSALSQPQVFVHRDYHSRNLMLVPNHNPGILDFQDAVKGPITYDLVSLLRDCYLAWPLARVKNWAQQYYSQAHQAGLLTGIDETQFFQWFDWMGIQRHLKASGIFARLYHRDGKDGYLKDIPRTLNYIAQVGPNYPQLAVLHQLVSQRILPAFQQP